MSSLMLVDTVVSGYCQAYTSHYIIKITITVSTLGMHTNIINFDEFLKKKEKTFSANLSGVGSISTSHRQKALLFDRIE